MPNPYADAIDALGGTITVETATAALAYVDGLPGLVAAIAERLDRDSATYCDGFPTHPAAGLAAGNLATTLRTLMSGPAADMGRVFRAVHEHEMRRLTQPRINEDRWDISRNRI